MNDFDCEVENILSGQKIFFQSGAPLDIRFRRDALNRLYDKIKEMRLEINAALYSDLRKSEFEIIETETSSVLEEIIYMRKKLKKWAKPKRTGVHLNNMPAKGRIYPEPYGSVLIFSTWNYPFQLAMSPLIAAMAAGKLRRLEACRTSPRYG